MSIDKTLEKNLSAASEDFNDYLLNPDSFNNVDVLEFGRMANERAVAFWARGQEIETSYSVAKKVIESIN